MKHTTLPVETPINSAYAPSRTKRAGQPTVNLGGDKMAAFLHEMKSAKLRKTGSLASIRSAGTEVNPPGQETNASTLKRRLSAGGIDAGNKRQRTDDSSLAPPRMSIEPIVCVFVDPVCVVTSMLNRRLTTSNASFDFSSIPREDLPLPTRTKPPPEEVRPLPSIRSATVSTLLPPTTIHPTVKPNQLTRGSGSTDDTPSLCSDHEPSQENSTEDRLPVTPPHAHRRKTRGSQNSTQQPAKEVITIDESPPALTRFASMRATERQRSTDILEMPPPTALSVATSSPPARPPTPKLIFPRRIPSSPMPQMRTPKRPHRPAKSRVVAVELPKSAAYSSNDELEYASENDDHALSFLNEKSFAGVTPYPKTVTTGILPGGHTRRKTLDEEIRIAEDGGSLDSGVLVGVGTRNKKRGFLKGGGAAGTPVHMGVGYVIGAEESEDEGLPDNQMIGRVDFAGHEGDVTARVEDGTDEEDERLLAIPPSAIPVQKGQTTKRSWLPVAVHATGSAAGLRGRGRRRR